MIDTSEPHRAPKPAKNASSKQTNGQLSQVGLAVVEGLSLGVIHNMSPKSSAWPQSRPDILRVAYVQHALIPM